MDDKSGQHATRISPKLEKNSKKGGIKSFIAIIKLPFIVLVITLIVLFVWKGVTSITCSEIRINNLQYVNKSEVLDQIPVAIGDNLYDINIVQIESQLKTLSWVDQVVLSRSLLGVLSVELTERTPLVVVLDLSGRPAGYLDVDGISLPLHSAVGLNLPILSGVIPGQIMPQSPVAKGLPALLKALARSSKRAQTNLSNNASNPLTTVADWLISEIIIRSDGNVSLLTSPVITTNNRQRVSSVSIPVALGRNNFDLKLKRLVAFWQQAVQPSPKLTFEFIDLRFDNQIITH